MRLPHLLAITAFCLAAPYTHAGTASVDMNSPRQTIDGFGGSSAWSAPLTDTKADVLFGNANNQQLGLSLLRIRIDPNNGWAAETTNSQKAHARGAKVIGTAWTPPASMKTNNNVVGGSLLPGQYGAYVTFLNSASDAIGLDYVSPQNEPDITVTYESCSWTPANFLSFCLNNAQNLNRPLVVPESFHFDDAYSDPVLNDPTAASRVAIVGGHIYGAGLNTHQNALNKGKPVWMTEHYFDNASAPSGEIAVCMNIAKDITDCMANNMSAYIWWWMYEGLPYSSCDILIGDTPQKNAYVIAQFAKWVRPGCVRVDATYNPSTGVYVTGYKNSSGQAVIIAVNTGGTAVSQAFAINNGSATSVNAYRTSASENLVSVGSIGLSAGTFTTSLPAQSVTTFAQIDTAPTFTTQPANQTVTAGHAVTLSAAASGTPVPTYQWKKNNVTISGATGNTYTILSAVSGDAGSYTVVATNSVSSVTSDPAVLTVLSALSDFNGDGKSDILLSNTATGDRAMWFMNGTAIGTNAFAGTVPTNWVVSGTGDLDGDGKADIFWTNTTTGDRAAWLMNGNIPSMGGYLGAIPVEWVVSGSGDFNGDGKSDIVWTNTTTGERSMWLMNGLTASSGASLGVVPVAWTISGTGDFNGDGKADILLSNTTTGDRVIWFMNGATISTNAFAGTVPPAWLVSGVGDFDGDGKADIFWTNTATGDRAAWLMNGNIPSMGGYLGAIPVEWTVSATGDYNGDGKADVLWTNTATGERSMWLMNGLTASGGASLGVVPVAWVTGVQQ